MNAAVKILLGLILIAIGLGLFVDSITPIVGTSGWFPGDWLTNFLIVLTGFIPPFLILIGLFVVWLEIDEIKAEREIRAEEEKEKEKPKKKK
jgi:hypothetical protein